MKKNVTFLAFLTILLFCSWNLAFSIDKNLDFLTYLSNEDLKPLVTIIENKESNKLSDEEKNNPKDHLDKILSKLENAKEPFSYRQIIEEVCKKENIEFNDNVTIEQLGSSLIKQFFSDSVNKMGIQQKENLIKEIRDTMSQEDFDNLLQKIGGTNGFFISSGEKITQLLLDSYSTDEIFAVYIVTGVVDCYTPKNSDPLYIVNVPAVTYIEAMRMIQTEKEGQLNDIGSSEIFVLVLIPIMGILFFIVCIITSKKNISLLGKVINFLVIAVLFFLITFFSIAIVEEFNFIFVFFIIFFVILVYLWTSMQLQKGKQNNIPFFSRLLNLFVTTFLLIFVFVSLLSSYGENGVTVSTILFIFIALFFLFLLFLWRSVQSKKRKALAVKEQPETKQKEEIITLSNKENAENKEQKTE